MKNSLNIIFSVLIVLFIALGCGNSSNTSSDYNRNVNSIKTLVANPSSTASSSPLTATATATPKRVILVKPSPDATSSPITKSSSLESSDTQTVKDSQESTTTNSRTSTTSKSTRTISPSISEKTTLSGASARCRDGSLSFSQNRRGTCSHHGGVAQWF
jgi:hypothetical protein